MTVPHTYDHPSTHPRAAAEMRAAAPSLLPVAILSVPWALITLGEERRHA